MKNLLAIIALLLCGCEVTLDFGNAVADPHAVSPDVPTKPVVWSPTYAPVVGPNQCPDGKCPQGAVIYDGGQFIETPTANLPKELRQSNWGGGSCVFASTVSALRWNGEYDRATYIRQNYSGGAGLSRIVNAMETANAKYAYTSNGDESFLRWCNRTRRQAMIFYYPSHAVTFVGFHGGNAYLLDNNRTGGYQIIPEREFLSRWRGYGGTALAPLDGSPCPPVVWTYL